MTNVFLTSWHKIRNGNLSNPNDERKVIRRLKFTLNRLSQLGLEDICSTLVEIVCEMPWLIRNPALIIESMARQGFVDEITKLLVHYEDETETLNEYLKAIILRSIRFIDNFTPYLWDELVQSTTSNSIITCLLATETWLKLGHKCTHLVKEEHIESIRKSLVSDPPPIGRLQKNYRLILGRYRPDILKDISVDNDYLNQIAQDIALEGKTSGLFDYEEPDIIRKTYYSGRRSEDANDNDPSPR